MKIILFLLSLATGLAFNAEQKTIPNNNNADTQQTQTVQNQKLYIAT